MQDDPRGAGPGARCCPGETAPRSARRTARVKAQFAKDTPKLATRQSSQGVLEELTAALPDLIGGSADLTGSNGTKTKAAKPIKPGDFSGTYIHYGVREHGMAAAMNGIALHGGFIPFGGTFLSFSDYSRPAIRLGALMGIRVIHVMTHDSIGLGEDGPTHQPVEHFAALRAIPNLLSSARPTPWRRPKPGKRRWKRSTRLRCSACRARVCRRFRPRADLAANLTAKGAYSRASRQARAGHPAGDRLGSSARAGGGEGAGGRWRCGGGRVDAMLGAVPQAARDYRRAVLGDAPRVAVEAGCASAGTNGSARRGVRRHDGFGASAPAEELYPHFSITAEAVARAAKSVLHGA